MSRSYPNGTRFTAWSLVKDGDKQAIRRWATLPDGTQKFERFPLKKYEHIRGNKRELEDFVIRLNGKDPRVERIKSMLAFKHAYISDDLMDDYRENYLFQQIPTRKDALSMFQYLNKYCLEFFISKSDLKNPLDWHRHQHVWGKYLLNKKDDDLDSEKLIFNPGEIKSAKVIRYTVNELNRFMKYLHLKRPDEVPALTFEPISRAAYKEHEARRKMTNETHVSKYVKPADWEKIRKRLEDQKAPWRFAVYLAYHYGLRRNETMGLQATDVRKAYLACDRQFSGHDKFKQPIYKPLKNRLPRRIPHWLGEAAQAYAWINDMQKGLVHPDTLTNHFASLVKALELPDYVFHDLRRTFITNAVKKKVEPEELRLAVGHSNIQTTYKYYVMDARELEEEIWIPEDDVA